MTGPRPACIAFLHAHPDDEAIFTGGTIAALSAVGHRVVVIVATSGQLGRADGAETAGTLAARRRDETREACRALGVARVEFLEYRDSGMPGDPANHAPGAFFTADTVEAATQVGAILEQEAATSLVVYDAGGIYGHPDHIQVHRVGTLAAHRAGIATVYQATVDREYLHFVETHLVEHASDAASGAPPVGVPSVMVTNMVDVRAHLDAKRAAIAAHASQVPESSGTMAMPHGSFAEVYGFEWYVREGPPGPIDLLS